MVPKLRYAVCAVLTFIFYSVTLYGQSCPEDSTPPVPTGSELYSWVQTTQRTGTNTGAGGNMGQSVNIDGDYAIVGASNQGTTGAAYIYQRSGQDWVQQQELLPTSPNAGMQFGYYVSIHEDYAIVGANQGNVAGSARGKAYVYHRSGTTWALQQVLIASDGQGGDNFGHGVRIYDSLAVVGAYGAGNAAGAAYVFSRTGTTWSEAAILRAATPAAGERLGFSVGIDRGRIVAGADENLTTSGQGAAYVFEEVNGTWSLQAKLTAGDGAAKDRLGFSVDIFGDYVVAGARHHDAAGSNAGAAYVFHRASNGSWSQQAKLLAADASAGSDFGMNVGIDSNLVVVGAHLEASQASRSGAAYVFSRGGSTWAQVSKVVAADAGADFIFGRSVDIDRTRLVVGASKSNGTGAAYFFEPLYQLPDQDLTYCSDPVAAVAPPGTDACGDPVTVSSSSPTTFSTPGTYTLDWTFTDAAGNEATARQTVRVNDGNPPVPDDFLAASWQQLQTLQTNDQDNDDGLGSSIAVDGNTAIVGAPGHSGGSNLGAAYIFTQTADGWTQAQQLVMPVPLPSAQFGVSVAISGEYAVVGAWFDGPSSGERNGAAHVYHRLNGSWVHEVQLTASDGAFFDGFGFTVAMDNDLIAIGAPVKSSGGDPDFDNAGAVYLFRHDGTQWAEEQKLISPNAIQDGAFGTAISCDANRVLIGAPGETVGEAYLYAYGATGWTLTTTIDDLTPSDYKQFGSSVGLSDTIVVIGAESADSGTGNVGAAYVYHYDGSSWMNRATLKPSVGWSTPRFGDALTLDGDRVTISNFLFERSGSSWSETARLPASSPEVESSSRYSSALSGNSIIVGAYLDGSGNIYGDTLYAYDYRYRLETESVTLCGATVVSPAPTAVDDCGGSVAVTQPTTPTISMAGSYAEQWRFVDAAGNITRADRRLSVTSDAQGPIPDEGVTLTGFSEGDRIIASDGAAGDHFGDAVAIDGNTAVVTSRSHDGDGIDDTGAIYVFERTHVGASWQQATKLLTDDRDVDDFVGNAVAIHGNTIVVGSTHYDGSQSETGVAYVFRRDPAQGWLQVAKLEASDPVQLGYFGSSVGIAGHQLLVGAMGPTAGTGAADQTGAVYVFEEDSTGSYVQRQRILASDAAPNSRFGYSLDVWEDRLIVGSPFREESHTKNGAAYVFERTDGHWAQTEKLLAPAPALDDYFGFDVAMRGDRAVVGCYGYDGPQTNSGAAFVYQRQSATDWNEVARLEPSAGTDFSGYGYAVDLGEEVIAVGAYAERIDGRLTGGVYTYLEQGGSYSELARLEAADQTAQIGFGEFIALSGGDLLISDRNRHPSEPSAGSAYFFAVDLALPAQTVASCATYTAPAPTATDDCTGPATGTTTDGVTVNTPGDHTVAWSFVDGNGNQTRATRTITYEHAIITLPLTESVESNSSTVNCWITADNTGDGEWAATTVGADARGGTEVFALSGGSGGHDDVLSSPVFAALPAVTYALSYSAREGATAGDSELAVHLVDGAGVPVTQLARDAELTDSYGTNHLLFEVPAAGNYRIAFSVTTVAAGSVYLDDIELAPRVLPADGALALFGDAKDDHCESVTGHGLNGLAWARFLSPDGRLLAEVNANGNDLGDVVVEMTDYSTPPVAPFTGQAQLSRYFNITPENGPGPYTVDAGVKVRLYFTAAELAELNVAQARNDGWAQLVVTHYSGINEDCEIGNSTDNDFELEVPEHSADFGGNARYLEFTTTTFSEFGAGSQAAFPIVLTSFSAVAEGPANLLEWTVESEIDFSHYLVERSTDGIQFSDLGRVDGAHQANYSFTDPAPAAPTTYYRLKMVDYDGSMAYSNTETVTRNPNHTKTFAAYPVPTQGKVTLLLHTEKAALTELVITNALGRELRRLNWRVNGGRSERTIDLNNAPPGAYQVQLINGKTVTTLRLVKK